MKRMFLAIFDMHQESSYRVITAENLTDEEKKVKIYRLARLF